MEDYYNYLEQSNEITDMILHYIDNDDESDEYFVKIIKHIQKLDEDRNIETIRLFLKIFSSLSRNHNRQHDLINKIEKIIISLKSIIMTNISNIEIFKIFEKNPRMLFTLFEHGMITSDYTLYPLMFKNRYSPYYKLRHFLFPVIKKTLCQKKVDKVKSELQTLYNIQDFELFEKKCKIGENDSPICEIIRNDEIDEFITYVTKTDSPLSSHINPSIFETNEFLFDKTPTLIEYAAFFGSIQIFRFLLLNDVKLTEDLFLYAIHGRNADIIHILESNKIKPKYDKCLFEAIKCNHNEITNYIFSNYLENDINKIRGYSTYIAEKDRYYDDMVYNGFGYFILEYYTNDSINKLAMFYYRKFDILCILRLP